MIRRLPLLAVLLLFHAKPGWNQQVAPARLSFSTGIGYDTGDFGTTQTSSAVYIPFSFRYTASRFDISVGSSVARLSAPDGIRLIDGVPVLTQTGTSGGAATEVTGIGDTVIRSRFFLVEESPDAPAPSITPFVRLKIPTASADRGLGTGETDYGFGVEVDKDLGSMFVFGDVGYTVVGKVPRLGLRNRTLASFGIGKALSEDVSVSGMLDWRRSIVAGNPNPTDLVGLVSWRIGTTTVSPNAFVGLTDGSSDFGAGIQVRFRF